MAKETNEKEKSDTKLFEEIIKIINDNRVLKKKVMDRLHESKARYQRNPNKALGTEAGQPADGSANKKAS